MNPPLEITIIRSIPYRQALQKQLDAVNLMRENPALPGMLLLVEHTPVITLGRSGTDSNLLASRNELTRRGIALEECRRGGDITYHGPGQWTMYPVLNLASFCKDLGKYMRMLEEVVIGFLATYGIAAARIQGKTGVWVGNGDSNSKIAAIGIAVTHWISYHGLAVNIHPDLDVFRNLMIPCGISPEEGGVTSLDEFTGRDHEMSQAAETLLEKFFTVFPFSPGKRA